MLKKLLNIFTFISLFFIICALLISQQINYEIITVSSVNNNETIPIVLRVYNASGLLDKTKIRDLTLTSDSLNDIANIKILRGAGCTLYKINEFNDFSISADNKLLKTITIDTITKAAIYGGNLIENEIWIDTVHYIIKEELIIPEDKTLRIKEGVKVLIDPLVNIKVNGNIICEGTKTKPIIFKSSDENEGWGGIEVNNESSFEYIFFINGGADSSRKFGHSNSQPVVKMFETEAEFNNCYFIYNPGKAFGTVRSKVYLDSCLISNCDTGGEFAESYVELKNTYIMNTPSDDTIFVDDDNDGCYFNSLYWNIEEASIIDNCVFINGMDDAIDHNGAWLDVRNCWIEGFMHEGIACSNKNKVNVFNTVVLDCEQGIEAGYGKPDVNVNHCVLFNNDVGLRFGDSYDWGCEGHITIKNSILYNNNDNIHNFDLETEAPVNDAIDISYSISNDPEYDTLPNCYNYQPEFDELYYLLENSAGKGLADDESDLGLIKSTTFINSNINSHDDLAVYPNPLNQKTKILIKLMKNRVVTLIVYDSFGREVARLFQGELCEGDHNFTFNRNGLTAGIYFYQLRTGNEILTRKMIIK
ncbi:T9SS type A sorting domain-containing protein [Bacteroidota bacterium]